MDEKGAAAAIIASTIYFVEAGPHNTATTLELAARRAEELDIRHILVATTTGRTGAAAARRFKGRNVVAVSHSAGFASPGGQELTSKNRRLIEAEGARVLTCQHAFGGVGRAVRKKLQTYELEEIMAYTLRIFGEGMKVAVEIAVMAADAGCIPTNEPCLSIGGTGRGADTAVLLRPANAQTFFDLRIMEIIAKPRFG